MFLPEDLKIDAYISLIEKVTIKCIVLVLSFLIL